MSEKVFLKFHGDGNGNGHAVMFKGEKPDKPLSEILNDKEIVSESKEDWEKRIEMISNSFGNVFDTTRNNDLTIISEKEGKEKRIGTHLHMAMIQPGNVLYALREMFIAENGANKEINEKNIEDLIKAFCLENLDSVKGTADTKSAVKAVCKKQENNEKKEIVLEGAKDLGSAAARAVNEREKALRKKIVNETFDALFPQGDLLLKFTEADRAIFADVLNEFVAELESSMKKVVNEDVERNMKEYFLKNVDLSKLSKTAKEFVLNACEGGRAAAEKVFAWYINDIINEKIGGKDKSIKKSLSGKSTEEIVKEIVKYDEVKDLFEDVSDRKVLDPNEKIEFDLSQRNVLINSLEKYAKEIGNAKTGKEKIKNTLENRKELIDKTEQAKIRKRQKGEKNVPLIPEEGYISVIGLSDEDKKKVKEYIRKANERIEKAGKTIETDEEKIEKTKYSRAGAEITLSRVKKFSDLNGKNEKERNEKFLKLTRELWNEFAVHGFLTNNEKGELELKNNTDLDGKCSLELLKLAGFNKNALEKNLKYVAQGEHVAGAINVDTGGKDGAVVGRKIAKNGTVNWEKTAYIDHHAQDSKWGTSATMHTYKLLVDMGLLQKNIRLDRMVDFVTKMDNAEYPAVGKYFENSWKTIAGLQRFISREKLIEFFLKDKHPDPTRALTQEELKKYGFIKEGSEGYDRSEQQRKIAKLGEQRLEEMEKDGMIISSQRYGRIAVSIENRSDGKRQLPGDFIAARAGGCDTLIVWNPENDKFKISSRFPISEEYPQGMKVREKMWITPANGDSKLEFTLEDILMKMTDGKLDAQGKLKEYLENEKKGNEEPDFAQFDNMESFGGREKFGTEKEAFLSIEEHKRAIILDNLKIYYERLEFIAKDPKYPKEQRAQRASEIKEIMLQFIGKMLDKFASDISKEEKIREYIFDLITQK